jgi:phage tail-like protein
MPLTRTDPIRSFKFEVQFLVPTLSTALNTTVTPTTATATQGGSTTTLSEFARGLGNLGFAAMSGLAVTNEVIQYREGGMNTHPHKMVGQTDFAPISFNRGVFENQDQLWKWQRFIHNWQAGAPGSTGGNDYRCDVVVYVYDHPHSNASYTDNVGNAGSGTANFIGNRKLGIKIFNAWPASFTMSGLNASGSEIMVHELSLVHEGFIIEYDQTKINALASAS